MNRGIGTEDNFGKKKYTYKKKRPRSWRTKERKDNDVEIIISGPKGEDIAAELKAALQKIKRSQELSYYMTIRK